MECSIWFHFCDVLEQTKLMCGRKKSIMVVALGSGSDGIDEQEALENFLG